jgi:tellurium resistance protein TerD
MASKSITLSKGQKLSLAKAAPGLKKISVGLGWDPRANDGQEFDLDASAFLLTERGMVSSDADFIFYNQIRSACGSVEHSGDNRSGDGDGDDESINIDLTSLPASVKRIAIVVTVHESDVRRQSFGQVKNSYIRIIDQSNDNEICRYDLEEDYSSETAIVFGELYLEGSDWQFKASGQGQLGGLSTMCQKYGINI